MISLLLLFSFCCIKKPASIHSTEICTREATVHLSSLCSPLCPFPNLLLKVHKPEQVGEKDKSYPSLLCKQSCFCKQFISLTEPLLGKKLGLSSEFQVFKSILLLDFHFNEVSHTVVWLPQRRSTLMPS